MTHEKHARKITRALLKEILEGDAGIESAFDYLESIVHKAFALGEAHGVAMMFKHAEGSPERLKYMTYVLESVCNKAEEDCGLKTTAVPNKIIGA